jgi:hypothetical protein
VTVKVISAFFPLLPSAVIFTEPGFTPVTVTVRVSSDVSVLAMEESEELQEIVVSEGVTAADMVALAPSATDA